jgi:bisphosphoglycerate-independent phosphoglycerate mutase (AlkP superfamily)
VTINAGPQELENAATPRLRELNRIQFDLLTPWNSERHDYVTCEMAIEYLKTQKPRLLHLALGETDDWAHEKRYDRTLESIAYFDRCLRSLWQTVEALPEYSGRTGLVVTTDHGRGGTLADWSGHGTKVEGADRIWMALLGPDVRETGEAAGTSDKYQRDVAPTILQWLGLKLEEYSGMAGQPIR